jgi:universal stress protein E
MEQVKHILVVVDPSAGKRQAAVDKAAVLARSFAASVELLICDIESARADSALTRQARSSYPSNTQLLDLLDALAAPLRGQGILTSVNLIYGKSLHHSLLEYIRGSNADLIVKDTHHHSYAKRSFLVNTDWHLAHGSPIPLLLTKPNEWGRPPVVMAAVDPDRSKKSEDGGVLQCAATVAGRLAGDLHVIHTFVPFVFASTVMTGRMSMTREYTEALQVENSYRCSQIEQLAKTYGVTPGHLHVEMGTPKDCLPERVRQHHSDVLVIGASSHGRWHRMLIGSTASSMVESLPCDILIVHRPVETEVSAS